MSSVSCTCPAGRTPLTPHSVNLTPCSRSPLSAMGSGPPPECGDATPSATATATGYFSEPGSQADTRSSRSTSVPVASSSAHLQPSTANAHAATTAAPSGSSPVQGLGGRGLSRRGGQDVGPSGRASAASSSPGKGSGAAAAPGMVRLPPGPVVRRGPAGFTGVPTRSRSPGAEGEAPGTSLPACHSTLYPNPTEAVRGQTMAAGLQ